jgi:phosphate-selective porin OprO/OprP
MAMPFVNLTRQFQLVGRYTFLDGDGPNTVRITTYESRLATGLGDRYNELYVGVNYFFYGHKFKLQSGLQLAHMQDSADDGGAYSGVSWNSGLRLSW